MTTETDTPETPAPFRYSQIVRYELAGPIGQNLDLAVAFAVDIALPVEPIGAGRYRLAGAYALVEKVREWVATYASAGSIGIEVERPPESRSVRFKALPARPSARTATIHGQNSHDLVARAVDAGLSVACVGLQRYTVTGPTLTQAHWLATCLQIQVAQALEKMGLTTESAAKEDAAAADLPPISINLPVRETTSVIDRDRAGDITRITQTERSVS